MRGSSQAQPRWLSVWARLWLFCLALLLSLHGRNSYSGPLRIVGTEAPPFMSSNGSTAEGFCVDIVKEIQRRLADRTSIELMPWPRVLAVASSSSDVLLPCAKRTESREATFIWAGPVFVSRTYVYAPSNSSVRASTLQEVKALPTILAQRDSYSYEMLTEMGFKNLVPARTGLTSVKMLLLGRAVSMVSEAEALDALLKQADVSRVSVKPLFLAFEADTYLAFSRGTPDTRWRPWQDALSAMKQDGTFERIFRTWFNAAPPSKLLGQSDAH